MANKIEQKLLKALLDSYEKSKTFIGENKNQQSFRVQISKLFPKYDDDSEYEFYKDVNAALANLDSKRFVKLQKEKSGKVKSVLLEPSKLSEVYEFIKRTPKFETNNSLQKIWDSFADLDSYIYKPLSDYLIEQKNNLSKNKRIVFFDGDVKEYKNLLSAVKAVLENKDEIFIRELSVKLFNDSKKLESIESQVRSLLYRYGEYDDKDTVFEEHNILKTPTYVMVKGKGVLNFGQTIDLSQINGDIGLSTKTLNQLVSVDLQGAKVVTIENLTNFHKFQSDNQLVIYLGGFHNSIKRDFIKRVNDCNPGTSFFHFGDIDAGGFYILEHLIKKTGIVFVPFNMNIETLKNHKSYWKTLSENDKSRLQKLLNLAPKYSDVIQFMLENNCKLEQEAEILN
ncbi:Wadjet anti-phage system protein JetD domain-containing protein [Treponema sp.]|uniref:Wadjet anti-phage system protein JetD domain-containing protein n=1 Tax=Treponema sp. TaxID=166 RepID=UPI00388F29E7